MGRKRKGSAGAVIAHGLVIAGCEASVFLEVLEQVLNGMLGLVKMAVIARWNIAARVGPLRAEPGTSLNASPAISILEDDRFHCRNQLSPAQSSFSARGHRFPQESLNETPEQEWLVALPEHPTSLE